MNRACYRAGAPFLYRNVTIRITSRRKLHEKLAEFEENPLRRQVLVHARSLKLIGHMPLLAKEEGGDGFYDPVEYAAEVGSLQEYYAELGDLFVEDPPDGSAEEVSNAWELLASMIEKCKNLTDLIWICWNQLPPCLLRVIHHYHPTCRLDVRSFRLRSLRDPVTDPHELDLIQSPCLYSISVKTFRSGTDGKFDYNSSAILQVVALAPNLRHLNIVTPCIASSPQLKRSYNRPWEPWKGFVPPLEVSKKGALTSLSYFGTRGMPLEAIQEWPKYTDLSKIRSLILGDVSDHLVFRYLALNVTFVSLELLDFELNPTDVNRDWLVSESESFMEQLKPLTEVRVSGYLTSSILNKILQRHGRTMRRLTLNAHCGGKPMGPPIPRIRSDEILMVESHCPLLEFLSISISYTGDVAQDEYGEDSLSNVCPNLRHLRKLELHISSELSNPKAARKIWELIDDEKGGCQLNCLQIVWHDVSLHALAFSQ